MQWAPEGRSLNGQELADRVGISKQKVSALLSGERATVTREVAGRIAATLGVHQRALFFEPMPTPMGVGNSTRKDSPHEHQRALDANAPRRAQELGRHPRQGEPYRSRPTG
ncbi:helix-turn-helix domain-containing protein [Streptomyces sp. NPDC050988]|uniref:helix-turn-helix domain-containing protein n=1 Tax=Streptomyces sp. NPDC050988 TaxID=3365637 RepID=UPI00378E3F6F